MERFGSCGFLGACLDCLGDVCGVADKEGCISVNHTVIALGLNPVPLSSSSASRMFLNWKPCLFLLFVVGLSVSVRVPPATSELVCGWIGLIFLF